MHIFIPNEAEVILHILFNPTWPEDKLIWNCTLNGIYTVKSRYKVGMDFTSMSTSTEGPSSMHQESRLWNYIYSLSVQLKLRIFYEKLY